MSHKDKKKQNRTKKDTSTNVLSQISSEQISKYKTLFNLIDQDHDGKITSKDLKTTIVSMGMEGSDDNTILSMLPKSGSMRLNEFLKLLNGRFGGFSDESELQDAFGVFENDSKKHTLDAEILKQKLRDSNTDEDVDMDKICGVVDSFSKQSKTSGDKTFHSSRFIEMISN